MNAIVVYYSLTGNTDLIARTISEATGADMLRLVPAKDVSPKGLKKFFWGGTYDEYVACDGEAGARAKGVMQVEGKEYEMQDGDVAHFRVGA